MVSFIVNRYLINAILPKTSESENMTEKLSIFSIIPYIIQQEKKYGKKRLF
jgi:hypothetical protein